MAELCYRVVEDLSGVDADAWDRLEHGPSPFLEHGFLRALELSRSIGHGTGWVPQYVLAECGGELVGAVPAFIKDDSYGEFIFDWAWAHASRRAGLPYYPKLVVAAPVTPVTGHRILCAPDLDRRGERAEVVRGMVGKVREVADRRSCHSIHWLFVTAGEQRMLGDLGFAPRASYQYHWLNQGYRDFDGFLAGLVSRRRKQIRKERRRCSAAIDRLEMVGGHDLTGADLDAMDRFYRSNVWRHGGADYLRPGFFHLLQRLLGHRIVMARAVQGGDLIAGAFYLETDRGLYGRYWGCDREVELLHFEASCYAAIERAIARGIPRVEAGAQGEHKLLRGFAPVATHSAHWFREPRLARAIAAFLREEAQVVAIQMRELRRHSGYRGHDDPRPKSVTPMAGAGSGTSRMGSG